MAKEPETKILSPDEFVQQVAAALPDLVPSERVRLLEHARAWATVTYDAELPPALEQRIRELEQAWLSPTN